jgi:hypothetical protein
MSDYHFDGGRTVKEGQQYGSVVAFCDSDGTIKSERHGSVIGFLAPDGTVKADRYGDELGIVETDGCQERSVRPGRG